MPQENDNTKPTSVELPGSIPYDEPSKAMFTGNGFKEIGKSAGGRPLTIKYLKSGSPDAKKALLVGGVHGNETEGIAFMEGFCREFALNTNSSLFNNDVIVFPVMNPDGLAGFKRQNDNGVDLNRNMATKDWQAEAIEPKYYPGKAPNSEPETKALLHVLDEYSPDFIISFHSWKPMVNVNGPAHKYADVLSAGLNYIITEDIGYPTPGSLGTFAGWERGVPTITLEFERGISLDSVYPFARDSVIEAIKTCR